MKRSPVFVASWLVVCLLALPHANAQKQPDIGYIYPAGGQRDAVVDVTVGGQFLDGVNAVYLCGEDVKAEVIEHFKPIPRKMIAELGRKILELNQRRQAGEILGSMMDSEFTAFARSKGLEKMNLAEFKKLRTKISDPTRQPNAQLEERVTLRITIADDARLGSHELRLGTPAGLTNPLPFQVGQYREFNESEPNNRRSMTPLIEALPAVINGQIMPGDVDCLRFKASKGMRLVAAVEARRLIPYLADAVPGWFQAMLSLQDAHGNEVAFSDDFGFRPDPVICYEIPEDGEYILVIHDAIYRGREDFVYRITLGVVPFITSVFPLGGRVGRNAEVHLTGWNLASDTLTFEPKGKASDILSVSARGHEWESNSLSFALDTLKDLTETEPNDQTSQAVMVALPAIVNGRIETSGDRDVYQFNGRKGQQVIAEVRARRLDSELDSLLKLTDDAGNILASNDDFLDEGAGLITHQADSLIAFTLPKDATYFVHVSDTRIHGGEAYGYRLRISPPRPDFSLRIAPSSINARPGMTVPLTVYALRQDGFNGRIDLALSEMPADFSLSGGWISAGKDKVQLSLTVPGIASEEPVPLQVAGRAKIRGRMVERIAVPADDMMQAFLYRHLVPMREALVSVQGRERRGQVVRILDSLPVKLPVGQTSQIHIAAPKGPFIDRLQLELRDPPQGFSIQKVLPHPRGITILLDLQGEGIQSEQQGNLIIEVFVSSPGNVKGGRQANRRVSLGILPAIPYETVAISDAS